MVDYLVKRDLVVLGFESKMKKGEKLLLKELGAETPTGTLLEVVRGYRPVPADWSKSFVRDVEKSFEQFGIKLPLKKGDIKDAQENFDNWSENMTESANKMSPLYILNEQTQSQIKGALKSNAKLFVSIGLEAALYCALYHHAKQGLKHVTRKRRYTGRIVSYTGDIVFPTPLFGPIFGFLLRLASPF
ncbi:hypothetical protein WJX84_003993 [Apatococcus fuscideae]|uniref:Uncharacterized protein n=1 Tax=Apatococcus fuscideae TaxID=2026836 RepID=A0AAW1T5R9_9CHLO